MAQTGDKIGPYILVSKIGHGAFGVVWLAEKRTLYTTTKFALKLPKDEDVDVEAIKREAKLWEQVSGHPNVLPIIEADNYDGQIVIVSEFATGGTLADWLEEQGGKAPSMRLALRLTENILAGLEHLHTFNPPIIHRDLKPDNILLQGGLPRLADFGIARALKSSSQSTDVIGTLPYMAPEAFDGVRSKQTDLWAVGVIFYQMVTGCLPFPQRDMASLINAITRLDPTPLPNTVPHALQVLIAKSLQKNHSHRFRNATEMSEALEEAGKSLREIKGPPKTNFAKLLLRVLGLGTSPRRVEDFKPGPTDESSSLSTDLPPRESEPIAALQTIPSFTAPSPTVASPTMQSPAHETSEALSQDDERTLILEARPTVAASPPSPSPPLSSLPKPRSLLLPWVMVGVGVLLVFAVALSLIVGYISRRASTSINSNGVQAASNTAAFIWKSALDVVHKDRVNQIALSPDRKMIATAQDNKVVRLWDAQTGTRIRDLPAENKVYTVAFSPNGQILASGGQDGYVRLWNIQTGGLIQEPKKTKYRAILSIAFAPDGQSLAIGGSLWNPVMIWNIESQEERFVEKEKHKEWVHSVYFSPDGQMLVTGSNDDTIIRWNVHDGTMIGEPLRGHTGDVLSVAFSPDSQIIASGSRDRSLILWNARTGEKLRTEPNAHSGDVRSVIFSPDGKLIATASEGEVKLWNAQTGALEQTLNDYDGSVTSLAFSRDGKILASSDNKTVKLWEISEVK